MRTPAVSYHGLDVVWAPELDGGGMTIGQDFIPIVQSLFGRVGHIFEPCAGCGFVGFSLLAHDLCDRLTLSDINPAAVELMRETVRRNGLAEQVEVLLADGLTGVPREGRFDLVVANPPWYPFATGSPISDDPDWVFHRSFYAGIAGHLSAGASVLFQENSVGAEPAVFLPMLAAGGLAAVQALRYAVPESEPTYYILWSKPLPDSLLPDRLAAPESVTLELGAERPSHDLAAGRWHTGQIVNRLDRPVDLQLVDQNGDHAFCLFPLQPGQAQRLTSFQLPPGDYRLHDTLRDTTVMVLRVHR